MLLLQHPAVTMRLSEYLGAHELMDFPVRISPNGREPIDGIDCLKIEVAFVDGEQTAKKYLWIAPSRNYLPLKHSIVFQNGRPGDLSFLSVDGG